VRARTCTARGRFWYAATISLRVDDARVGNSGPGAIAASVPLSVNVGLLLDERDARGDDFGQIVRLYVRRHSDPRCRMTVQSGDSG